MFTKFFLTLPSNVSGSSVGSTFKHGGSTIGGYQPNVYLQKLTMTQVLNSLAVNLQTNDSSYYSRSKFTKPILINIPDEVTFQLEALSVIENTYCTYNVETKKIGFGSTEDKAYEATRDSLLFGSNIVFGSSMQPPNVILDFSTPKKEPGAQHYSFTVPDAFYEEVLNELIPYIDYNKLTMFNEILTRLIPFKDKIFLHLDDKYNPDTIKNFKVQVLFGSSSDNKKEESVVTIPSTLGEVCYVFEMFLKDDPIIVKNKESLFNEYSFMGELCLKIMSITNETF